MNLPQLSTPISSIILIFSALAQLGCHKSDPTPKPQPVEVSFDQQLAKVKTGSADEIRMEHTALGAAELLQLDGLLGLRALVLDAGAVGDEDVKHLVRLAGLEHLRLRESPLSDQGIRELGSGSLKSLLILNLPQARPTAEGLKELAGLPKLRQLRIAGRQIDDAAIRELSHYPSLSSLHLIQPGITASSLDTLAAMQNLSSLYIDDCPLPDEAWASFFAARPDLHVHIDQAHHDMDPHAH